MYTKTYNSDMRQPLCVSLYNGKELRVEYTQSNTTIITSIINIMRVLTTTCFGLTFGPPSRCKIRLDKLCYNAWETYWEKGAGLLRGTMVPFYITGVFIGIKSLL